MCVHVCVCCYRGTLKRHTRALHHHPACTHSLPDSPTPKQEGDLYKVSLPKAVDALDTFNDGCFYMQVAYGSKQDLNKACRHTRLPT
jgi:hypothetical protein